MILFLTRTLVLNNVLTIIVQGSLDGSVHPPVCIANHCKADEIAVPIVFSGLFGLAMIWCFSGTFTVSRCPVAVACKSLTRMYSTLWNGKRTRSLVWSLPDFFSYPLYAASALAANSFARSSFAAGFPYVQVQNTLCKHRSD